MGITFSGAHQSRQIVSKIHVDSTADGVITVVSTIFTAQGTVITHIGSRILFRAVDLIMYPHRR